MTSTTRRLNFWDWSLPEQGTAGVALGLQLQRIRPPPVRVGQLVVETSGRALAKKVAVALVTLFVRFSTAGAKDATLDRPQDVGGSLNAARDSDKSLD